MTFSMSARADRRWPAVRAGELELAALIGAGMVIVWDPARPGRCAGFRTDGSGRERAAVRSALLGGIPLSRPPDEPDKRVVDIAPWLRLAAVTALDRLLGVRLDHSLCDAEIAASRFDAASTLPSNGIVAVRLTEDAFHQARRSAVGVAQYLERLAIAGRRLPAALEVSLARLADSYARLAKEVDEPDDDLVAVAEAWHRLSLVEGEAAVLPPMGSVEVPVPVPGQDLVDPRQVPTRLVPLGTTVEEIEVRDPTSLEDHPAVRIGVSVRRLANRGTVDLRVRVVDRRSGGVLAHGLVDEVVTTSTTSIGEVEARRHDGFGCYQGVIVLPTTVRAADVRVDLTDDGSARPPAGPHEVRRARRAAGALTERRARVADLRLRGIVDGRRDVRGPGDLLVAELAAAYERSTV